MTWLWVVKDLQEHGAGTLQKSMEAKLLKQILLLAEKTELMLPD